MAIYKEEHKLISEIDNFDDLRKEIEHQTGLPIEMEIIDSKTGFIHCEKFNSSIEINLDKSIKTLYIFFPPKQKGYIENALINTLNRYFVKPVKTPAYSKKKWKDLSITEKLFKK
jgi:hypothetical protein